MSIAIQIILAGVAWYLVITQGRGMSTALQIILAAVALYFVITISYSEIKRFIADSKDSRDKKPKERDD